MGALAQGSRVKVRVAGSTVLHLGFSAMSKDTGSRVKGQRPRVKDQWSRIKGEGSKG